ncbi:MAG: hypothetical protein J7M18_01750 [Candidatus Eremiobacteraeota bacterium]|nr:hypothetical protein [Candidatus Eremiobacteraeota bacterium]
MPRESKEFYSAGEQVDAGIYENLKNGIRIQILNDGDPLPEEEDGHIVIYTRISGNPYWGVENDR